MTAPTTPTLTSRREFFFCYDVKMGNPNGDPDENRPRVLPDKTHYVTDVRLKRFVRDFFKLQGRQILVDTIEGRTTNLTGRVAQYLAENGIQEITSPEQTLCILLDAFIDARLFGSTFAFTSEKESTGPAKGGKKGSKAMQSPQQAEEAPAEPAEAEDEAKGDKKKSKAVVATAEVQGEPRRVTWVAPKTLTGAVQIMHGEVKHKSREVDISGTSAFGSDETKGRGTFTTYYGLRYALVGFNGIANEHSARLSRMTDDDYALLLRAMWDGVRSAANTRTKRGQVPRLLLSVVYKPGHEFQFGNLADYVKLTRRGEKDELDWSSPDDYALDVSRLLDRLGSQVARIARIEVCLSPDVYLSAPLAVPGVEVVNLNFDAPSAG